MYREDEAMNVIDFKRSKSKEKEEEKESFLFKKVLEALEGMTSGEVELLKYASDLTHRENVQGLFEAIYENIEHAFTVEFTDGFKETRRVGLTKSQSDSIKEHLFATVFSTIVLNTVLRMSVDILKDSKLLKYAKEYSESENSNIMK